MFHLLIKLTQEHLKLLIYAFILSVCTVCHSQSGAVSEAKNNLVQIFRESNELHSPCAEFTSLGPLRSAYSPWVKILSMIDYTEQASHFYNLQERADPMALPLI